MAAYWMLIVIFITIVSVSGKPISNMRTQKRQSDQRVAELETLLALQKYGAHHFLRSQSAGEAGGSFFPAYGIIDFNKIGRKKKRFSPQQQQQYEWTPPAWATPAVIDPSNSNIEARLSRRTKWKELLDPVTPETDNGQEEDLENDM